MRIAVFGSTGRAGSAIVERALDQGHDVTAFARSAEALPWLRDRDGLRIAVGDAFDPDSVRAALEGREGVLSALGTGSLDPSSDLSAMTGELIKGLQAYGPKRLILVSHVGVVLKKVDPKFQHVADEHRANFAALQASDLDWVAVCPPGIMDEPAHGHVEALPQHRGPNWSLSRFDLADFMLEQLDSDEFLRQAVGVSN